ncbi:MAG: serine protease [Kribbellaceae bacterium]|nr:serine protease [Kribbellaceae bacterium]
MPAALVAATLVTVTGSSGVAAQPQPYHVKSAGRSADAGKPAYDAKSVLVKFKDRTSSATRQKALGKAQGRTADSVTSDVVKVTSDQAAPDLLKKLKADPSVALASLDYIRKAAAVPNDQFYTQYQKPYLTTIRMPEAWDLSKSAGTQTVAVLDTGIDAGHPDLAGKVLAGHNVISPGQTPNDDNGHGTMTSGIIGASTSNSVGVAGVAWNAKILPVKVLDSSGSGTDSQIIDGINWAAANGARVINMSLGGDGDNSLLHDAISAAVAKGIVVVASAGNTGVDAPNYPAAYPEVIAVGATDNNAVLTSFSTHGDWVDIAAPGWNIIAPGPRALTDPAYEPYWINSGTSFSAPMVAGVAALLRNKFPSYTPAQIEARLKSTARDAGPRGLDPYYGAGILDAARALGGSWAAEFWGNGPDGNDVPARATPAGGGPIGGSIGPEGDVDWYKLSEPEARSAVIAVDSPVYDWANRAQNFAPVVSVYDKDLNQLGYAEVSYEPETPGTVTASVNVNLVAGDNFIAVSNYNGSRDGRPYNVSVSTGAAAAPLTDHYWVRSVSPANYAGGAALAEKPAITFDRELDPATVTTSTVRLLNGKSGAVVAGAVDYDAATKTVTLTPAAPLQDNTPYRISVGAVQETTGDVFSGFSTVFRTVDENPGPVTGFDATGAYSTATLNWTLPDGITDFDSSDLDQIVVRRLSGTTPPTSPTSGTAVYAGESRSTTATGLSNATSYAFSAWVKDRSGKFSTPLVSTQLIGTATTLSGSATIVNYGSAVTLSGAVTRIDTKAPVAGQKITLYGRDKNGTTWRAITWLTTSATGTFSVSYKPSVNTVVAWGYDGSPDLLGSRTGNFTIDVRPTITANLTSTAIKLGSSTSFYGYVRPQHAGSPVYLQRLSGSTWTTITSTKLNSTGNYAFGIKPTARGSYTYRAVFQADADHATSVSATKTFSVS